MLSVWIRPNSRNTEKKNKKKPPNLIDTLKLDPFISNKLKGKCLLWARSVFQCFPESNFSVLQCSTVNLTGFVGFFTPVMKRNLYWYKYNQEKGQEQSVISHSPPFLYTQPGSQLRR